jgi:hypothetical protein
MTKLFSRERIGTPQILAGFLLCAFVIQCAWLIGKIPAGAVSPEEVLRVHEGLTQWHGKGIAGTETMFGSTGIFRSSGYEYDPNHSPLWYLTESAALAIFRVDLMSTAGTWVSRTPYVIIGALLGASLWYVSRRLYGNAGGYVALTLYCFSPNVIRSSVLWLNQPNIAGTWGTFGGVFTAIAVSHTLYAPREVVLWNWRRILLLGISLTLAIGSLFSLVIIIPLLMILMLYVAAERWSAAIAILAAACGVGFILLFSCYFFHPTLLWRSFSNANWLSINRTALFTSTSWLAALGEIAASGPVLIVLTPFALVTYAAWGRTRYFGITAPLAMAALFLVLRAASPHADGSIFALNTVVFLFVFIAGIAADLLETRFREIVIAVLTGFLAANALWNLISLAQIRS